MQAETRVFVIGNGMSKFLKPGKHHFDYPELANIAMGRAFRDANIPYEKVEAAYVGYVFGDSVCGQKAIYDFGMTGIPILNVNNNCATGSSALWLGHQAVKAGQADCIMALGFEKMQPGSLKGNFTDRANPVENFVFTDIELHGPSKSPLMPKLFGDAGREHMQKYGTTKEHFAKIAWKNHKHSANNPYA